MKNKCFRKSLVLGIVILIVIAIIIPVTTGVLYNHHDFPLNEQLIISYDDTGIIETIFNLDQSSFISEDISIINTIFYNEAYSDDNYSYVYNNSHPHVLQKKCSYQINLNEHYIYFTHPLNNDVLRAGNTINIIGTIFGENFNNYIIEYGQGTDPTEWHKTGIILINGGYSPIENDTVAIWDTSHITEADFYTLKITVNFNEQYTAFIQDMYLDPTLKEGWPQRLLWDKDPGSQGHIHPGLSEPVVSDINNDGVKEIIIYMGGAPPKLYIFDSDGNLLNYWSVNVELPLPALNIEVPTIVDIDNDGYQEIIVSGREKIFIYDYTGYLLESVNFSEYGSLSNHPSAIVATDLDYDGEIDLIRKYTTGDPDPNIWEQCYLAVFDCYGNMKDGWPQIYYSVEDPIIVISIDSTPAVGNFNDDPELEIAVTGYTVKLIGSIPVVGGLVSVFDLDGSILDGFPKYFDDYISSPSVADINNDGYDDVLIAAPDDWAGAGRVFMSNPPPLGMVRIDC